MPQESPHLTIRWGAKTYTTGELTAADAIAMEEEWGVPFPQINFAEYKAACWVAWLILRHEDPEIEFEAIASATMGSLYDEALAQEEAGVPPTDGSPQPKPRSGRSGSRGTRASTGSSPGTSAA